MFTATARIPTSNPSTTLKKLCRHFSHKIEAEFDENKGRIVFPFGRALLFASDGLLQLDVEAASDEDRVRLQNVLSDHLVRFASRENLSVTWAATTVQRDNPQT